MDIVFEGTIDELQNLYSPASSISEPRYESSLSVGKKRKKLAEKSDTSQILSSANNILKQLENTPEKEDDIAIFSKYV